MPVASYNDAIPWLVSDMYSKSSCFTASYNLLILFFSDEVYQLESNMLHNACGVLQ